MFVKENPDRKKKFQTLETKPMQDESNFHKHFGYTFRCVTDRKVRGGDACILWMDTSHYVSKGDNSSNPSSFNYVNYKSPETGDCMCRVRNNYLPRSILYLPNISFSIT